MKIWFPIGLALVLGIGSGVGIAMVRIARLPWDGTPAGAPLGIKEAGESPGLPPEVFIEETTHDFGFMDKDAKGEHDFVFENRGKGPLHLEQGPTSCKCTASVLEEGDIPPGGSAIVTIEWKAEIGLGGTGDFSQTAVILTNDPGRPRVTLKIKGRVTVAVRPEPSRLLVNGITAGQASSASLRVYGFLPEPLQIVGHEFEDAEAAEHFGVTCEPLTPDEWSEEEGATSGYLVEVDLKPSLPVGPFEQTILLRTNYAEAATVKVPVQGTVTGEVSIFGAGWKADRGVLHWGSVRSEEGAERKLFIRTSGPHANDITFKIGEVYPDLLEVELGKTSQMGGGDVSLTELTIRVPKGSRPADHLGSSEEQLGRIILETSHPQTPKLRILVRFAVQG